MEEGLSLIEEEEQFTHLIALEEVKDGEEILSRFCPCTNLRLEKNVAHHLLIVFVQTRHKNFTSDSSFFYSGQRMGAIQWIELVPVSFFYFMPYLIISLILCSNRCFQGGSKLYGERREVRRTEEGNS